MKRENALALRLKTVAQRYTQSEIARRTGTWVSNVHHYLNGTRVPADFLAALVEKCGVNAQWLLTGEGPPYAADLAPESGKFAGDVQKLSRALDAASKLKLGELFTQKRTRVLAEINEAIEAHEQAKARVSAQLDEPLGLLWDAIVAAVAAHDAGDHLALSRAQGLLASLKQLVRLSSNGLRQLEALGLEGRVALRDLRFNDDLDCARRSFLMAFPVLGPAKTAFLEHSDGYANALSRAGYWNEARTVVSNSTALARAAGNDPVFTAYSDVVSAYCAAHMGAIEGAFEAAQTSMARPGADTAVRQDIARPMMLDIALLAGKMTFEEALTYGPNCVLRRRQLLAFACWTEDVAQLRRLLRDKLEGAKPAAAFIEAIHQRWRRLAGLIFEAAWKRTKGLWREIMAWDDMRFSCSPERERAFKAVRACQLARLSGEADKARELLLDAQAALAAMPAGMDLFIQERATHHRNALVLGDGPKGSTKARNMRAQAQRWFREHTAKGYACFAGFGV
jgi:transcriptional regulator with XRE-family HTH domain